jgi:transcriptional regulator with XRE-family HTH domain
MTAPAAAAGSTVGSVLRSWRTHRRLSQLDLASAAGVSTRHLSCVETGRAAPSREMVLYLAEHLSVPLRERNRLLHLAGFAPVFRESALGAEDLAAARHAIDVILANHAPLPALAIDAAWNIVAANAGTALLFDLLPASLLDPPNVVRASLHREGLGRFVVNLDESAVHLVSRLRRQLETTGDDRLAALLDEVTAYDHVAAALDEVGPLPPPGAVLPLHLRLPEAGDLRFFTTMTVLGAPLDVTLDELAIESFFPADERTAEFFAPTPASDHEPT